MFVSVVDSELVRCEIALGLGKAAVPDPRLLARAGTIDPGLTRGVGATSSAVLGGGFGEQEAKAAK